MKGLAGAIAIAMTIGGVAPATLVAQQAAAAGRPDYRIHAGDEIEVRLYFHPDLLQTITVRPDGKISFPLIDDQLAEGRTPRELALAMETALAPELRNPQVSIQVKHFALARVYVGGEVGNAGVIPLVGPMTAMQAIMQAGGFRKTARINKIAVVRTTDAPKTEVLMVDLDFHNKNGRPEPVNDIALQSLDVVFVPKSRIASADDFVEQYVTKLVPIQYILGVQFYPFGLPVK